MSTDRPGERIVVRRTPYRGEWPRFYHGEDRWFVHRDRMFSLLRDGPGRRWWVTDTGSGEDRGSYGSLRELVDRFPDGRA